MTWFWHNSTVILALMGWSILATAPDQDRFHLDPVHQFAILADYEASTDRDQNDAPQSGPGCAVVWDLPEAPTASLKTSASTATHLINCDTHLSTRCPTGPPSLI